MGTELEKRKRGRPSKRTPEAVKLASELARFGATDWEIAQRLEIDDATLYRWRIESREFRDALQEAKATFDERVERALAHKATGYSFASEKIMAVEGRVERVPIVEHVPPDTGAAIFWLKNRKPREWRDRIEHTGAEGGAILFAIHRDEPLMLEAREVKEGEEDEG